jgi:hypothetical protein
MENYEIRNVLLDLGDHFKSGQEVSLQNRRTEVAVRVCLAKTLSVPEINNFAEFPQSQDLL